MPPSHPLRRISTGSLSSLARSTDRTHAPSDLDFLLPALTDLVDEAATLSSNVARLNVLYDALGNFNEGFSAYLHAMKMHAYSSSWEQAPSVETWARLRDLTEPEPQPEPQPQLPAPTLDDDAISVPHTADMTYMTAYSDGESAGPKRARGGAAGAKTGIRRPGASAAEKRAQIAAKRRRQAEISTIIDAQLPLEYRGRDADARLCMEKVMDRLWDGEGLAIGDMVKPPEMPHPRVNKCLIALVAKKLVVKTSAKGKTLYSWAGQ